MLGLQSRRDSATQGRKFSREIGLRDFFGASRPNYCSNYPKKTPDPFRRNSEKPLPIESAGGPPGYNLGHRLILSNKTKANGMSRFMRVGIQLAAILVWFFPWTAAAAEDPTAAELLPPTTVAFVEVASVPQLVDSILDHPLRQKLETMDQVKAAYEKKQFLDFKAGVAVVESQMGLPWRKILNQSIGGGVAVAVDAKTQGVVLLMHGQDEKTQTKLVETLANLSKLDATSKGNPDPVKTADYRGMKAYEVANAITTQFGRWMLVTNKGDLAKWIVDSYLDHPTSTLATSEAFKQARSGAPTNALAWVWANTAALRDAGVAKKLYEGKAGNALAELLFGGVLSTLQKTPFLTAALVTQDKQATLTISAPHDRSWAGETREYYFGPNGSGTAPLPLTAKDTIVSLRAYRDISAMWLRAGDLFDEKANEELAKADSNLSTLFGGKDFGEDILGSFAPEMQVVVAHQHFAEGKPQPAIKLPAFSFVFDLKDPETMQPELRRTFQSLIGFLNIVGAMNGQPQLEQDIEKSEKMQLYSSSYLIDAKKKDPLGLGLHYNFSPSVAFAGPRIVIASTKDLARELATAGPAEVAKETKQVNTELTVQFDLIRSALAENRGQLIAQNMLKEGHTKEEAEKEIDTLLQIVGWLDAASLRLGTTDKELQLSVSVSVDRPQ
jgi:hypothetical protein